MENMLIGAFIAYIVGLFAVARFQPSISKAADRIFPYAADEWTERVRQIEMSGIQHRSFSKSGLSRSSAHNDFYDNDSSFNEDDFDFHHQQGVYSDSGDGFDNY